MLGKVRKWMRLSRKVCVSVWLCALFIVISQYACYHSLTLSSVDNQRDHDNDKGPRVSNRPNFDIAHQDHGALSLATPLGREMNVGVNPSKCVDGAAIDCGVRDCTNCQSRSNVTLSKIENIQTTKQLAAWALASFLEPNNHTVKWFGMVTHICGGYFIGYGHHFAILKHARLNINDTFEIPCNGAKSEYRFSTAHSISYLNEWYEHLETYDPAVHFDLDNGNTIQKSSYGVVTVVLARAVAYNLYHTMCEWYNIFIIAKSFDVSPKSMDIVWMDEWRPNLLDDAWDTLFGHIHLRSAISPNVTFQHIIWATIGYNSNIQNHASRQLLQAEEFRDFFLVSHDVDTSVKLNCSTLQVTIIWRRDYAWHPGRVQRKFKNHVEIVQAIRSALNESGQIRQVLLEELTMQEQVEIIAGTDVLIGMHGAGMAHIMFLPKHAAVLEFFPRYYGFNMHGHYRAMARWRGVKYFWWQNNDVRNEFRNFHTRIPPHVVTPKVAKIKQGLCPA